MKEIYLVWVNDREAKARILSAHSTEDKANDALHDWSMTEAYEYSPLWIESIELDD